MLRSSRRSRRSFDMCGIVGLLLAAEDGHANQELFDSLTALQHRGQDAAGIVTCDTAARRLFMRKDNGLCKDVFQQHHMMQLRGRMGLAHCRYPTAGGAGLSEEAQPMYTNYPFGVCLAHNGNLTNVRELKETVFAEARHINTDSDSELLINVFAKELTNRDKQPQDVTPEDIFDAVGGVISRCEGGYAVVVMINGIGIVGFRDPNGIRPLVFGTREKIKAGGTTKDYVISSESVVMDMLGFKLNRDVAPGECVFVDVKGNIHTHQCQLPDGASLSPCLFEYVYFARPDSVLDKVPVYEARLNMGAKLAKRIREKYPDHDIDVVVPIPDTARTSALQCAYQLGIPYREGFIKNRYIARTFIMPGQAKRKKTVRLKLNTIRSEFVGKNVLLVDDSIVRGTTSMELVQMAREAGARKVYLTSAAPPVRFPNVYGIDIPTKTELVAHNRTSEQVAERTGADWVLYQQLDDLEAAVREVNPDIPRFDSSCFSGEYVTGDISEEYLEHLHAMRNDSTLSMKSMRMLNVSSSLKSPKREPSESSLLTGGARQESSNSLNNGWG
ncbi:unnamed protein product [Ectocarpus sp. CCAP 1310/34]|nr:unnamed protein product [Ectocarpus sp. CCAP 1310/34]